MSPVSFAAISIFRCRAMFTRVLMFLFVTASATVTLAASQEQPQVPIQNDLQVNQFSTEAEPPVSRREASDIARDHYAGGRVLSIRMDRGQWRMRMDQEGNVFDVLVNASSGEVSRPPE
jgi:uncharacterized membrane protein YkoI